MSDLIKREDATSIPELPKEQRKQFKSLDDAFETGWNEALACVNMLPSAEAVQGEWIDYIGVDLGIEGQWLRDDGKTVFVQCDQCDRTFVRNLMTHMNYCPNCGAKMKGADHETD